MPCCMCQHAPSRNVFSFRYQAPSYISSPASIKIVRLAFSAWVCQDELELHTHLSSSHQRESSFIASRVVNPSPLGLHQDGPFFLRIIGLSNRIRHLLLSVEKEIAAEVHDFTAVLESMLFFSVFQVYSPGTPRPDSQESHQFLTQ